MNKNFLYKTIKQTEDSLYLNIKITILIEQSTLEGHLRTDCQNLEISSLRCTGKPLESHAQDLKEENTGLK